ncbi:MAG: Ig-like domain repeat protein [Candidatus Pacebacteria bacterium]|nr:Ig-like domain repeat protein [Candidatus Paceibacterota bacterium]
MIKKYKIILILLGAFILSTAGTVQAGTGFVDTPLWLTPPVAEEGSLVTLRALFRNEEENTLSGTVIFYDGDVLLGRKAITIPVGTVATASVTFRIGAGEHSFSAQMSNLSGALASGKYEPVALALPSAKLEKFNVTKTINVNQTAQASKANSSVGLETPILNQIDAVEKNILASVPESLKEDVVANVKVVENFRISTSDVFSEKRNDADRQVAQIKITALNEEQKSSKVAPATKYVDRPLAYVKYGIFSALAFIFATPIAFYLLGIILAFLILRYLYRKIADWISARRIAGKRSRIPRAPEV